MTDADDSTVLCSEPSPDGRREALVEDDGRVIYMYLWEPEAEGGDMRSCWVRNRLPAPDELDANVMRDGSPPLLPAANCRHPRGASPLDPHALKIVWLPEGAAAALFEHGELLAILPAWSGANGLLGYARDCVGESRVCREMPEATSPIIERIHAAALFWERWKRGEVWEPLRDRNVNVIEAGLGCVHTKYYAIDGGNWPTKALLRFDTPDAFVLVTVGVCLRPQPELGLPDDPRDHRRIELACAIGRGFGEAAAKTLASYIAAQSALPWSDDTWLGEGHTIPCDAVPVGPSEGHFDAVMLTRSPPGAPSISIPEFDGDPVNLYWLIPISEAERKLAMDSGSEVLLERLRRDGVTWVHRDRPEVA